MLGATRRTPPPTDYFPGSGRPGLFVLKGAGLRLRGVFNWATWSSRSPSWPPWSGSHSIAPPPSRRSFPRSPGRLLRGPLRPPLRLSRPTDSLADSSWDPFARAARRMLVAMLIPSLPSLPDARSDEGVARVHRHPESRIHLLWVPLLLAIAWFSSRRKVRPLTVAGR